MTKTIGIIGGLGPVATISLIKLLNDRIPTCKYVIINDPTTPDRTRYILDHHSEDPTGNIISMVKKLEALQADIITMPCNTASYFYAKIKDSVPTPFINIVEESAKYFHETGCKEVGLLATEGTIRSKIYEEKFTRYGIHIVTPPAEDQKIITSIIYDEVKSNRPVSVDRFNEVVAHLQARGVHKIILGCTELSVIYEDHTVSGNDLVDSMIVLADAIRDAYEKL